MSSGCHVTKPSADFEARNNLDADNLEAETLTWSATGKPVTDAELRMAITLCTVIVQLSLPLV